MDSSNAVSSQDYNSAVQEALAAMGANYQELMDYLNGIDHDNTQIDWDKQHIDAKTRVRDTHHEIGPDGKTHTVYTYRTVNKYSNTQIQIWENDIAMREANQSQLQSQFNQGSGALERLAAELAALLVSRNDSGKSQDPNQSQLNLNLIMQNIRQLFKDMNATIWPMIDLLSHETDKHEINGQFGFASSDIGQPTAPSSSVADPQMAHEAEVIGKPASFDHDKGYVANAALIREIQLILPTVLLAHASNSADVRSIVEESANSISNNSGLSVQEKQLAFLALFMLIFSARENHEGLNPTSASPNSSEATSSSDPNTASILEAIRNHAEENARPVVSAEGRVIPVSAQSPEIAALASDPLSLPSSSAASAVNQASQLNRKSLTDLGLSSLVPMIDKTVAATALVVVAALQGNAAEPSLPETAGSSKEQPAFQAAQQAIGLNVDLAVQFALQKTIVSAPGVATGNEQNEIQAGRNGMAVLYSALAAAHQTAAKMILIGKVENFTPGESMQFIGIGEAASIYGLERANETMKPTVQPIGDVPAAPFQGQSPDGKINGGVSINFAPGSIQQFLSNIDELIGSGTYSQLAVEGAFGALVRSASTLQQLLTVDQFGNAASATSSGVDAIEQVGDGPSRGSANSLSAEIVKEQKQQVSTSESKSNEEESEGYGVRSASDVYHQILAV